MARVKVTTAKGTIGSIEYSMLTLAQFQNLNGTTWVLADGTSCTGTAYASITGFTLLPDHRGVVPRGKNNGLGSGQWNPDGDSALGTFQSHATSKNGLALSDGGHSHQTYYSNNATPTRTRVGAIYCGDDAANLAPNGYTATASTGVSLGTGDNETRMKNITLNAFIKVN